MMTRRDVLFLGPAHDPSRYQVSTDDLDHAVTGGEGIVYRARRTTTGEAFAVKVLTVVPLTEYPQFAARAALLEQAVHPHLMEQVETFLGCPLGDGSAVEPDEFDVAYSVAEWIEGRPLSEVADGADLTQKLRWIRELAAALDHLHHCVSADSPHGIIHRDVKPSNVMVRNDGTTVLLDFGVARPVDDGDMTQGVGTYLWRAPEVLSARSESIGAATDVWGLGAIAHWLLVDAPPPLDGAAAARERIATRLIADGCPTGDVIARQVSELLHSASRDRPCDLLAWSRRLGTPDRRRIVRLTLTPLVLGALAIGLFTTGWNPSEVAFRPETTTTPTTSLASGPAPDATPDTTIAAPDPLTATAPGSVAPPLPAPWRPPVRNRSSARWPPPPP